MTEPLALNIRKVLCVRSIIWQILGPQRLSVSQTAQGTWTALEQGILDATDQGLTNPASVPLDRFLQAVALPACESLPQWTGPQSSLLAPLFLQVQSEIQGINCQTCSHLPGEVCRDGEFDEEIFATGGHCGKVLTDIFNSALTSARGAYQKFASMYPASVKHKVDLCFKNKNEKPHKFPNSYWISAVTAYGDTPNSLVSEVTVFLSIEKFDVDTFLSCLYVFMHECVCHVFQGLTTAELRPTTEPTDRFAEGWMDFIAAGLLGKSFGNAAAQLSVANFEQERVGADYHSSRLNYLHPDRVKYAVQWAHGRQAAQKILHLFAGLPETCNMVNEAFLKLSFDLNLCPLESRTRELLIAQIDKYLPLKGEKFGTRYPDFVAIVRKYLINNDINSFVPDVIAFG